MFVTFSFSIPYFYSSLLGYTCLVPTSFVLTGFVLPTLHRLLQTLQIYTLHYIISTIVITLHTHMNKLLYCITNHKREKKYQEKYWIQLLSCRPCLVLLWEQRFFLIEFVFGCFSLLVHYVFIFKCSTTSWLIHNQFLLCCSILCLSLTTIVLDLHNYIHIILRLLFFWTVMLHTFPRCVKVYNYIWNDLIWFNFCIISYLSLLHTYMFPIYSYDLVQILSASPFLFVSTLFIPRFFNFSLLHIGLWGHILVAELRVNCRNWPQDALKQTDSRRWWSNIILCFTPLLLFFITHDCAYSHTYSHYRFSVSVIWPNYKNKRFVLANLIGE